MLLLLAVTADRAYAQETTEADLYVLCYADPTCAARFFLSPTPSSYGQQLFDRLLGTFFIQLNIDSLDAVPVISNDTASAWWWLSLLRTAQFCDGQANTEFVLGLGCSAIDGQFDGDVDSGKFSFEYVTLDIIVVFSILVVCYYTYSAGEQLGATRRSITAFTNAYAPPSNRSTAATAQRSIPIIGESFQYPPGGSMPLL
jgi:hypothetical protein